MRLTEIGTFEPSLASRAPPDSLLCDADDSGDGNCEADDGGGCDDMISVRVVKAVRILAIATPSCCLLVRLAWLTPFS